MISIMSDLDSLFAPAASISLAFAKGAYLFHQDDPVRVVYRLFDGAVQLRRQQAGGACVVLQRAQAGTILAEASLFADHYHCDALAVAATRASAVPVATLRTRLAASPALAAAFAAHLAREVQAARLRAEILGLKTVGERLDAWLAWQHGRLPERGGWALLAGELGVTPEALYRELARRRRRDRSSQGSSGAC
jgi:CRP-like cAMP-binding protein